MKEIIKKILKENSELPKKILKYIEISISHHDNDMDEVISDLVENLGVDRIEAYTKVFQYLISIGEDPTNEIDFDDLTYHFYGDDAFKILSNSGWVETYLKDKQSFPRSFKDIEETGDGEKFLLVLDDWEEFSCMFDERDLASRVLQSDWAELYGWFDVDYENDIVDNLNEKSIQHIQEYIRENGLIGKPISDNQYNITFEGDVSVLSEEMINDIPTLLELIGNDDLFFDLLGELENAYRLSYESASESEIFGIMGSKIEGFFGSKPYWGDNNKLYLDVTTVFYDILVRFLICEAKFPGIHHSYFLEVVCDTLTCEGEEIMAPDMNYFYPDSRLVEKDFNEYILNNI